MKDVITISKLKCLTVLGTRPEIIRLAPTIRLLDAFTNHTLVHTGQNSDFELNQIFFEQLNVRKPDVFLGADTSTAGAFIGSTISKIEIVLQDRRPDAFLVLGDTNSALSAIVAKRMGVPVFHMEAGNRSFDENVPEETNRKLVDHIADYNLVYSDHARRNLLDEGIHPSRILLTGSPMMEVRQLFMSVIEENPVLEQLALESGQYFVASLHRQENVDDKNRLFRILNALEGLAAEFDVRCLLSLHPRTAKRLAESSISDEFQHIEFHKPFGFFEYINLQMSAKLVLSDSGSLSEESAVFGFRAVSLRDAIERPEAIDTGTALLAGSTPEQIAEVARFAINSIDWPDSGIIPDDYLVKDFSRRVVSFVLSSARTHHERSGLRLHF